MELHDSFLGAWREFGWLPEMFGLDLKAVDPNDPGCVARVGLWSTEGVARACGEGGRTDFWGCGEGGLAGLWGCGKGLWR